MLFLFLLVVTDVRLDILIVDVVVVVVALVIVADVVVFTGYD